MTSSEQDGISSTEAEIIMETKDNLNPVLSLPSDTAGDHNAFAIDITDSVENLLGRFSIKSDDSMR